VNHSLEFLVLADDLTGAAEIGAIFAERGLSTIVTTELDVELASAPRVLVVDTESRHLPSAEAGARVSKLASRAVHESVSLIYKKTDSTLRGNIGSELHALRAAAGSHFLFYVPAYPEMGRTVRAGHLYVNDTLVGETSFGSDALNPVKSSYIPDLLYEPASLAEASDISNVIVPGTYVCDGETDHDLQQAAKALLSRPGITLAAGPAGLAKFIARMISPVPPAVPAMPRLSRCLVVSGSRHEQSKRQVEQAILNGWTVFDPRRADHLLPDGWCILENHGYEQKRAAEFATDLGAIVSGFLGRCQVDCLILFGGDTAFAILSALRESRMHPLGEILPGLPIARIGTNEKGLYVITKAGGFGPLDVLSQIRTRLGS
jgi:uncharacterized protein YgbK (DUF1537 family)